MANGRTTSLPQLMNFQISGRDGMENAASETGGRALSEKDISPRSARSNPDSRAYYLIAYECLITTMGNSTR